MGDDSVVRELDVYLGAGILDKDFKIDLVQYPLRPTWRPYDFSSTTQAQYKPKAGLLQVDTGLEGQDEKNAKATTSEDEKPTCLKLQSSVASLPGVFAAAVVRENHVVLLPVTSVWQLRPDLTHLDADAIAASAAAKEKPEGAGAGLVQVHGNMRRVENEKQQAQRLASYAHLEEQERKEPWLQLDMSQQDSELAADLLTLLSTPPEPHGKNVNCKPAAYLDALIPAGAGGVAAASISPLPARDPQQAHKPGLAGKQAAGDAAGVQGALDAAVGRLFQQHPVLGLSRVRQALKTAQGPASTWAAQASDLDLHGALLAASGVAAIGDSYIARKPDDPWRSLVLELLQAAKGKGVKRSDIFAAASAKDMTLTDSTYTRTVTKALKLFCESKAGGWTLKAPA